MELSRVRCESIIGQPGWLVFVIVIHLCLSSRVHRSEVGLLGPAEYPNEFVRRVKINGVGVSGTGTME